MTFVEYKGRTWKFDIYVLNFNVNLTGDYTHHKIKPHS
jgi:hypothetical protein